MRAAADHNPPAFFADRTVLSSFGDFPATLRAVAALVRSGFRVELRGEDQNPVYAVRFAAGSPPLACFSKVYDHALNPDRGFCAIMTCSSADAACPIVRGSAERIFLPYDDPGSSDGTGLEAATYDDCCRQIAREMLAVLSRVCG